MGAIILGGGLAGLSLAHNLKQETTILEKEERCGGLCRSFSHDGIVYDVGPHIFFSKDKKTLEFILSLMDTNVLKRSNKIFHRGRFVKYPFENGLSALDEKDRDYCLTEFLNNPYEGYKPENMLQFFLKTFGEGITQLYLEPYNEKIWKFSSACMDTQMVERIPKPPKQDIIDSANGAETEGYTHQLFFNYPKKGGTEELIKAYVSRLGKKTKIVTSVEIKKIRREGKTWHVETNKGVFTSDTLINCMPLQELFGYIEAPKEILDALNKLRYNSIHIVTVQAKKDAVGDNFALYLADKDIIFHRLSKLDFLGESYKKKGASTLMLEITYRPESYLSQMPEDEILQSVIEGLEKTGLVKKEDVVSTQIKTFPYAYVIYDLDHRKNTDTILKYLSEEGIKCCGRFAEFEYLNMDGIVAHSDRLAKEIEA